MIKKGLYILVAICVISLMTGFGVHHPVKEGPNEVHITSPFDIQPPRKTAILKALPSANDENEDAARQNHKGQRRAKGKFSYVRHIELVPLISSIDLNSTARIPSLITQHFHAVISGALPHYYAFLFRLTPF